MRANEDGRLWPRVIAAAISAGVSLLISLSVFVIMFQADSRAVDAKKADAIWHIERRIDTVEAEARKARRPAAEDRQKIAEIAAELRSTSRGVSRIELWLLSGEVLICWQRQARENDWSTPLLLFGRKVSPKGLPSRVPLLRI